VKTILVNNGYRVIEAIDGEDACASDAPTAADRLALSDVVMPRMKGPEMISRLRSLREVRHVLYMSGYVDTATSISAARSRVSIFSPSRSRLRRCCRSRDCIASRVEAYVHGTDNGGARQARRHHPSGG